jgi:hypothetical protein
MVARGTLRSRPGRFMAMELLDKAIRVLAAIVDLKGGDLDELRDGPGPRSQSQKAHE